MAIHTDLAIEAKRIWDKSADEKTKLAGVKARQSGHFGIPIDIVEILDQVGAERLGKPIGTYVTIELKSFYARERNSFRNTAEAIARVLHTMLPSADSALVVGLGNREITPDSLGPLALSNVIVTHHLLQGGSARFADVCAFEPGVLGTTGIESVELVKAALEKSNAACLIVVDALASCEPDRICTTVQITDTGIEPGSGVGNRRAALNDKELGVPVFAIGVPTVMDAQAFSQERKEACVRDLILTPRSIDARVREIGKLLGYGINLTLQPNLTFDDIPSFLS